MPHQYTPKEVDRFNARVDRAGGPEACWPWVAPSTDRGTYGTFSFTREGRTVQKGAHVVAYEIANDGKDPGLYVLHGCDNKPCCNPKHLKQGTQRENIVEAIERGLLVVPTGAESFFHLNPEKLREGRVLGGMMRHQRA